MKRPAIVQIRIEADTREDAEIATEYLNQLGAAIPRAKPGRKGGYLAYGTLTIDRTPETPATSTEEQQQ